MKIVKPPKSGYVVTGTPIYYPQHDEVNFSEEQCPNCKHECFSATCSDCGGEGGRDGYEEDPLWYDEGDIIPCDLCRGNGHHHWCPRCGWDMQLPDEWNTAERRGLALVKFNAAHHPNAVVTVGGGE